MNLFEYDDYLLYVKSRIELNQGKRGYLSQLAEAARCQRSYFSQVLKCSAHLTPEHGMGLALFWELDEQESEYFVQLVHLGRTSFPPLRNKIQTRLRALRKEREHLAARLNQPALDALEMQAIYYSTWLPSAIDVLVSIDGFRTPQAIATRLILPLENVKQELKKLEKIGTVIRKGNEWYPGTGNLHLPKESPFTVANHQNWRSRAVIDAQSATSDGVHYTSVQSISLKDFEKVKAMVLNWIEEQREVAAPSKEEELACFTCDWFRV